MGIGLTVDHALADDHLYANLNYVWLGIDHFTGRSLAKPQLTGMLAWEWRHVFATT